VTGSNQKSNRDPLLNLSDLDVEEALLRLQKHGLVSRITGGRVERWRHLLYEAWQVNKVELAVLAELLLRGPQTEGELRTRASRMEPLDDLDSLRHVLKPLVERRLVLYLTPGDRRGAVLTHGFHAPEELEQLRGPQASIPVTPARPVSAPVPAAPPAPARDERVGALQEELAASRAEIATLKQQLDEMRATLQSLGQQVEQIKQGLGL
jgi:uncharacterized protein YceH (UPF0502 family)